jgi:hypothetical protein
MSALADILLVPFFRRKEDCPSPRSAVLGWSGGETSLAVVRLEDSADLLLFGVSLLTDVTELLVALAVGDATVFVGATSFLDLSLLTDVTELLVALVVDDATVFVGATSFLELEWRSEVVGAPGA